MRQFMLTVFKWTTWNVECVNVRFLLKHWKFLFPTKFSHIWSFQSILHHIVRTLRNIGWFIRNLFLLSLQTKIQKTFWLTPILLQLSGVMSFILWFWKKKLYERSVSILLAIKRCYYCCAIASMKNAEYVDFTPDTIAHAEMFVR